MAWTIDGEAQGVSPGGYDGSVWQWRVVSEDDPSTARTIIFRITGTAMSMGEDALLMRAAAARETLGRSEIEAICGWPDPPTEIQVDSEGVRSEGGDPGPEQREINEVIEWFDERGALLIFAARGGGSFDPGAEPVIQMTKHSVHVIAKGADEYLYNVQGTARLEVARRAKEMWEEEGRGVYVELQPADAQSGAILGVGSEDPGLAERKAEEAARAEDKTLGMFRIDRMSPAGEAEAIHMVEFSTADGDTFEGAGELQDGLLEGVVWLIDKLNRPKEEED